jgi:hypothetical protein
MKEDDRDLQIDAINRALEKFRDALMEIAKMMRRLDSEGEEWKRGDFTDGEEWKR